MQKLKSFHPRTNANFSVKIRSLSQNIRKNGTKIIFCRALVFSQLSMPGGIVKIGGTCSNCVIWLEFCGKWRCKKFRIIR